MVSKRRNCVAVRGAASYCGIMAADAEINELVLRFVRAAEWLVLWAEGVAKIERDEAERIAEDAEDVRLSRGGDADAYRRLIERHQEHVSRILWRFSRDEMVHEELVEDVFVEAYLSLRSYRGKAPFEHWVARIATRVGYHYWKERARRGERERFSVEEWDEISDRRAGDMEASEAAELVGKVLGQLGPRDRLVVTLRYIEGCDVEEAARRTGWSKTMVKVQCWRALKKLRKILGESEEEL